jgi:hypothetical protein
MSSSIAFDDWKARLRQDCERRDTLAAFNALSDHVLTILWERGFDLAAITQSATDSQPGTLNRRP